MTAVVLLLLATTAAPPDPASEKAVVMPIRVSRDVGHDVAAAAPGIEAAFQGALARHAPYHVLTHREIVVLVGKANQEQLMGCDAESCLAEVAGALGARWLVTLSLDVRGGLWNVQAALLDQSTAEVARRASVRARGLRPLMDSIDQMARQLAAGSHQSLADPALQQKLGTDAEGLVALQSAVRVRDDDVQHAWTHLIAQRNRESDVLALVEGLMILGGGGVVAFGAVVPGIAIALLNHTLLDWSSVLHPGDSDNLATMLPLIPVVLVLLAPLVVLAAALGVGAAFLAVLVVDGLDLGRVKVARDGCCRDELELQEAASPGIGRRLAPFLAVSGGALALTAPLCVIGCERGLFPCLIFFEGAVPPSAYGPAMPINGAEAVLYNNLARAFAVMGSLAVAVLYMGFAGVAALLLTYSARSEVVDARRE